MRAVDEPGKQHESLPGKVRMRTLRGDGEDTRLPLKSGYGGAAVLSERSMTSW